MSPRLARGPWLPAIGAQLALGAALASACGSDSNPNVAGTNGRGGGGAGGGGTAGGGASGSAGDSGPDSSLAPNSKRHACIEYLKAACARRDECGLENQLYECLTLTDECPDILFAAGSTRTVEGTLDCSKQWKTLSCEDVRRLKSPACASVGTRQGGEPCLFAIQCASLVCTGAPTRTCGTCRRLPQPGEQCSTGGEVTCPAGQSCNGTGACVDDPVPPSAIRNPGEACTFSIQRCVGDGYECLSDPTNASESRCQLLPKAGEPCGYVSSSPTPRCALGAYCGPQGTCLASPPAGQPCGTSTATSSRFCAIGSRCNYMAGICETDKKVGEPCRASIGPLTPSNCANGSICVCDDATCAAGTCADLREEGERCDEPHTSCVPGTDCSTAVCVAKDDLGLYEKTCGG